MLVYIIPVTTVKLRPMLLWKQLFLRYGVLTILQQPNVGVSTVLYFYADGYQLSSFLLPPSKIL